MAQENARLTDALDADEAGRRRSALAALAAHLRLPEAPQRVHCMDVSTIQGTSTVASRVCFVGGQPHRDGYRKFKIRGAAAGDDFAAMDQAVRRSLTLCLTEEDDDLPDLLIVDGGRGQLGVAQRAVEDLGLVGDLVLAGPSRSRLLRLGLRVHRLRLRGGDALSAAPRALPIRLRTAAVARGAGGGGAGVVSQLPCQRSRNLTGIGARVVAVGNLGGSVTDSRSPSALTGGVGSFEQTPNVVLIGDAEWRLVLGEQLGADAVSLTQRHQLAPCGRAAQADP
jgi:hypothetical protein